MNKSLSFGLLILRVSIAAMMLVHGWSKLQGFSEMKDSFLDPLNMGSQNSLIAAIAAEVGCSILLAIGLGTRFAALALAFTMGVALFVVHAEHAWDKKELAALYFAVYTTLIFTGAGGMSLDAIIRRRKKVMD